MSHMPDNELKVQQVLRLLAEADHIDLARCASSGVAAAILACSPPRVRMVTAIITKVGTQGHPLSLGAVQMPFMARSGAKEGPQEVSGSGDSEDSTAFETYQ
ncbi:hypothetical protein NDU88_003800 [Pleurodeles waltl]|uniref:Uncharacterized protein n=1 Tax=Pleurodeles waltl TaxID=8319 RepID=A0AAV7PHX5_PLEWA|nr:hypothetical protein NDU88_003800 [Pleurodeles waltl]